MWQSTELTIASLEGSFLWLLRPQKILFTDFLYPANGTTALQQSRFPLSDTVSITPFPSSPHCCLPPDPTYSSPEIILILVIIRCLQSCPSRALLTKGLTVCNGLLSFSHASLHPRHFLQFSLFKSLSCCGGRRPNSARWVFQFLITSCGLQPRVKMVPAAAFCCLPGLSSPSPMSITSKGNTGNKQWFVGRVKSKFRLRKATVLQSRESEELQLCFPCRRTAY